MSYKAFDLSGKVAGVTGGNGGIGLGMAEAMAQAGASVSIWGTNAEKNAAAAKQIAAYGGRVQHLVCDVSDSKAVDDAFAATLEEFGRVDSCGAIRRQPGRRVLHLARSHQAHGGTGQGR